MCRCSNGFAASAPPRGQGNAMVLYHSAVVVIPPSIQVQVILS
jgi:hypothetical protein